MSYHKFEFENKNKKTNFPRSDFILYVKMGY